MDHCEIPEDPYTRICVATRNQLLRSSSLPSPSSTPTGAGNEAVRTPARLRSTLTARDQFLRRKFRCRPFSIVLEDCRKTQGSGSCEADRNEAVRTPAILRPTHTARDLFLRRKFRCRPFSIVLEDFRKTQGSGSCEADRNEAVRTPARLRSTLTARDQFFRRKFRCRPVPVVQEDFKKTQGSGSSVAHRTFPKGILKSAKDKKLPLRRFSVVFQDMVGERGSVEGSSTSTGLVEAEVEREAENSLCQSQISPGLTSSLQEVKHTIEEQEVLNSPEEDSRRRLFSLCSIS